MVGHRRYKREIELGEEAVFPLCQFLGSTM